MRFGLIISVIFFTLVSLLGLLTSASIAQSMSTMSTSPEPYLVKDIEPGLGSSLPFNFQSANEKIFFLTGGIFFPDQLWISDGTITGTLPITDEIAVGGMSALGDSLIFGRYIGASDYSLWKTDGTVTETILLADLQDGSNPNQFVQALGLVFFEAPVTGVLDRQLWRTDGTSIGTFALDVLNSPSNTDISYLTPFGDKLFFSALDSSEFEMWTSDGTITGTTKFLDINPGNSSSPSRLTVIDDKLFFSADDGTYGREVWVTDGTITGTRMVKDIDPTGSSQLSFFHAVNGSLLFTANDGIYGNELWITDGTITGTVMVKDITGGITGTTFLWSATTENNLFFVVDDATIGRELWVSDGTEDGTRFVTEINPTGDAFTDFQTTMTGYRHKVYFSATDGVNGVELWESDGTVAGTFMIMDINPSGDSIEGFVSKREVINETLFFSATDGNSGFELWAFDILAEIDFSQETYFVNEDVGEATITITLDYPVVMRDVSFDYSVTAGSATVNEDFSAVTGTLAILVGETFATFTIPIVDDLVKEADETVLISLSNPVNGYFSQSVTQTLTIVDNQLSVFLPIIVNGAD